MKTLPNLLAALLLATPMAAYCQSAEKAPPKGDKADTVAAKPKTTVNAPPASPSIETAA